MSYQLGQSLKSSWEVTSSSVTLTSEDQDLDIYVVSTNSSDQYEGGYTHPTMSVYHSNTSSTHATNDDVELPQRADDLIRQQHLLSPRTPSRLEVSRSASRNSQMTPTPTSRKNFYSEALSIRSPGPQPPADAGVMVHFQSNVIVRRLKPAPTLPFSLRSINLWCYL